MLQKESILGMARGAIMERVDYEMGKIIDNIVDVNTKATGKRKITVTLEIAPDDERRQLAVKATAKSTLVPTNPIVTNLYATNDHNGELAIVEMVPQAPGQTAMDGAEQEEPKVLNFLKRA